MTPEEFIVRQALERYAGDCRAAQGRLAYARSLADLKRVADVRPQSIVSSMRSTVREHRQLEVAAERRAKEICESHLGGLKTLLDQGDVDGFKQALHGYRARDWQLLRGDYPRVVHFVDQESRKLEHLAQRPPPDQPPPERPRGDTGA